MRNKRSYFLMNKFSSCFSPFFSPILTYLVADSLQKGVLPWYPVPNNNKKLLLVIFFFLLPPAEGKSRCIAVMEGFLQGYTTCESENSIRCTVIEILASALLAWYSHPLDLSVVLNCSCFLNNLPASYPGNLSPSPNTSSTLPCSVTKLSPAP
jgi:hypothetical protein